MFRITHHLFSLSKVGTVYSSELFFKAFQISTSVHHKAWYKLSRRENTFLYTFWFFSLLSHYIKYLLHRYFPALYFSFKNTFICNKYFLTTCITTEWCKTPGIYLKKPPAQQSNRRKIGRPFFHHYNPLATLPLQEHFSQLEQKNALKIVTKNSQSTSNNARF